ncbi:MAG: hypothetical protein MUP13_10540, partial [Thermoanaerobaculales bacterium]|nr:hypothetical protein [Thermoanaerobaculales bacterium]
MRRFGAHITVFAILFGLFACSGEKSEQPIVHVSTAPPTSSAEPPMQANASSGLPGDWYVSSSDKTGMMLEKMDEEDAWIWVSLEASISGSDVNEGVKLHRKAIVDSPAGNYFDSGSIETAKHGSAAWSLGFYEGDGG